MIDNLANWINYLFLFTCVATLVFFYLANGKPIKITIAIILLAALQAILAYKGFYQKVDASPPRLFFVLAPNVLFLTYGLLPKQLSYLYRHRDLKMSIALHSVRILVETILYYLFLAQMVPQLMTFEGRNFDILAGLSAPLVLLFYLKKKINNPFLILWNIICLCLVLFIFFNAVLSANTPFQQFAFEQPNRAVFYFPFILLPVIIVPIVIYTHLTDILFILKSNKQ